jgi:hypothetical protein
MQMRLFAILFIALIMIAGIHSATFKRYSDFDSESRANIDVACTVNCAKRWKCRVTSIFTGKCDKPANCICDQFAWEG